MPETICSALKKAVALMGAMPPPVIGIAFSPRGYAVLGPALTPSQAGADAIISRGVPYIVDPRLIGDLSEVYYDEEAWQKRCREQRALDDGR